MRNTILYTGAALGLVAIGYHSVTSDPILALALGSKNRLNVNLGAAFNVKTEFQNVGAFNSYGGAQLTPAGDAYNYDDGYVLMDSSGNLMGYTRYWGYNYDSGPLNQLPGDGTILMNRYSSVGATGEGDSDEPLPGIEISFARELGGGAKWRWGIETSASYYHSQSSQSGNMAMSVTRMTDIYQLPPLEGGGFVTPPPAPYAHGPELSPTGNPVIGATPVGSRTDTFQTTVNGMREFEADIVGWKLGPYLELPLSEDFSLTLGGGLTLAYVGSDFQFNDQVALPGSPNTSGGGTDDDLIWGGYLSGALRYRVAEAWEISGAVQFEHLEKYAHQESARSALLDMRQAVMVTLGASYTF